jgi:hypothetical protein
MKNKGLPTSEEWNNIIDDAFSSEEKHDFSALYELRRAEIQKGITMKKTTNHIQRRYRGMVAAAAAIVIAAPASVYALSKALPTSTPATEVEEAENTEIAPENLSVEDSEAEYDKLYYTKEGENEYTLRFTPKNSETDETRKYNVQYTWLPEGFSADVSDPKHTHKTAEGGALESIYFRVYDSYPMEQDIRGIVDVIEVSDDDKTAYIFCRQGHDDSSGSDSYTRDVWIHFKGTNFVTELFATDDISDSDLSSIIQGMKLVDAAEFEDTLSWTTWNGLTESESDDSNAGKDGDFNTGEIEAFESLHIGDTFTDTEIITDTIKNKVEITLNNAWVQDNFDGISTDPCGNPADYSGYLSDDGKIYETYEYGILGDGVNTVDEVTDTISVQKKVIVLDLTYKNIGENDIYDDTENGLFDYLVAPVLINGTEWDANWRVLYHLDDKVQLSSDKIAAEDFLSLEADNKSGKNHINIPKGESTHVKIAMIANADDLDNLYVDVTGGALAFNSIYANKDKTPPPILSIKDIK